MIRRLLLAACLLALSSLVSPTSAVEVTLEGSVSLPGGSNPLSMAQIGTTLFIGMPSSGQDEVYAVDASSMTSPFVSWGVNLTNTNVRSLLADDRYVYIGSGDTPTDFRVLDSVTHSIVASLDLPSSRGVQVMEWAGPTLIHVYKNKGSGPDEFLVDVSDPLAPFVASESDSVNNPVVPTFDWPHGYTSSGQVEWRIDNLSEWQRVSYLANSLDDAELQIVLSVNPVRFHDANDDGIFRLGCMGDSNTGLGAITEKWCEKLDIMVTEPVFEIRNVGCSGSTAVDRPHVPFPACGNDSYVHINKALDFDVDAIVVAYGTNDHFFGYTPEQVIEVYLDHRDTALTFGMGFFVFTTPIRYDSAPLQALNDELNALILETFPEDEVIDVHTGFTFNPDYMDSIHMSNAGQQKRAERAAEVVLSDP